ncbi:hypothetical protein EVAR_15671_1 [Eumeta japonica]|uniref:Uncharacterized protein n=1 Tax=Eumeta variegata TaxID=151549 RepID=A0A4C1UAA6_EUMVA|nr:hypothetical protein EVAR_15671_1 [Eumeta japonica]
MKPYRENAKICRPGEGGRRARRRRRCERGRGVTGRAACIERWRSSDSSQGAMLKFLEIPIYDILLCKTGYILLLTVQIADERRALVVYSWRTHSPIGPLETRLQIANAISFAARAAMPRLKLAARSLPNLLIPYSHDTAIIL